MTDHDVAESAEGNNRYLRITIDCPHCGTRNTAVDSRKMSQTMREITFRCRNYRCGHVGVCTLEFVRTLVVSSIPAADIRLPLSKHIRRGQLVLQLTDDDNVADDEASYLAHVHEPTNDWGPGEGSGGAAPPAPPG